jgi:hypothetical protein
VSAMPNAKLIHVTTRNCFPPTNLPALVAGFFVRGIIGSMTTAREHQIRHLLALVDQQIYGVGELLLKPSNVAEASKNAARMANLKAARHSLLLVLEADEQENNS